MAPRTQILEELRIWLAVAEKHYLQHTHIATGFYRTDKKLSTLRDHGVWDPHQRGLINTLEHVQKFALKASTRDGNADYDTLIRTCNIPTMEEQHYLLKLSILLYQIINSQLVFPGLQLRGEYNRESDL